jgi:two-component system, response regulator
MSTSGATEILLVEDNPYDAELTLRALTRHRLVNRIEWVKDGEQALDFVFARGAHSGRSAAELPKVIILDLKLPKVDGLEVLKALKGDPATRLIPVVILTSSQEESDLVESYNLGANSYVVKPVEFEKFVEAVGQMGFYWLLLNKRPSEP